MVEHFVCDKPAPHSTLVLIHEGRLLGASSVFQYNLRETPGGEVVDNESTVEISVTVADDLHHQGIGSLLLTQAKEYAVASGKTYAYFSFEPGNEISRRAITKVLGSSNIVAGSTNPLDKFFRLTDTVRYPELELAMRRFCGEIAPAEEPVHSRHLSLGKFGHQVVKTIEILLPHELRP